MKKIFVFAMMAVMMLVLAACGGEKEAAAPVTEEIQPDVVLSEVMGKMVFEGDTMELGAGEMLDLYGINEADMKQFVAKVNVTGIDCDEVVLVEAVDAEAAGRVKECLDNRYQAKLNETENYLPDEYAIIKECAVTQNGNFVAMIVANNAADMVSVYGEYVK